MSDAASRHPRPGAAEFDVENPDPKLYRIAYEQSLRALDDQRDELSGMRQRAAQFLAFVGSATAFLVGSGLSAGHRTLGFQILAGAATLASTVSIGAVAWMLVPRTWNFQLSASILIDRWIERDVPRPNEQELLRALATRQDQMRAHNQGALRRLQYWYMIALTSGSVGILLWSALVWRFR